MTILGLNESNIVVTISVARGDIGNVPSKMENNCCRKMMLFLKALFLATTFPKILFLYCIFIKNFHNLLKISQQFVFFVQTHEKLTLCLLFFWNICQIMRFIIFLRNSLKIFENSPELPVPPRGRPLQMFPQPGTEILAAPLVSWFLARFFV